MKRLIFLILFFGFFIQLTGCISKNEVELYPCDTNNLSYAKHIRPIIQANCYKCHDVNNAVIFANGNYLDDYDNLKAHIRNGLVIGNIEHAPNFLAMPKGAPKLGDCDIAKIKAWVHQDTLNN
jgi:hypothetical protein